MELNLVIDILKLVVPTVMALVSLAYAMKQRNVIKTEISKKRYLESALFHLNGAIASLKRAQGVTFDEEDSDDFLQAKMLIWNILEASFDLRKRKLSLDVSYRILDLGETNKPYGERDTSVIRNLDEHDSSWFVNLWIKSLGKRTLVLESDTRIVGYERASTYECWFGEFGVFVGNLTDAKRSLSRFEEVYESFAPNSIKEITKLLKEVLERIFEVSFKPKRIEIDLDKFSTTDEVLNYFFEEITNYSSIVGKAPKISEIVSELEKARKELFLKIY